MISDNTESQDWAGKLKGDGCLSCLQNILELKMAVFWFCCAVQSGRSLSTFQICLLPPSSGQHARRQTSSYSPPWEPKISRLGFHEQPNNFHFSERLMVFYEFIVFDKSTCYWNLEYWQPCWLRFNLLWYSVHLHKFPTNLGTNPWKRTQPASLLSSNK
jgi:hypothetical protein